MVGDERDVLVGQVGCRLGVFGRVSEGIESEEIRRDDGDEHQNVDCRGPQRCSSESGSSVANFQRNRTHIFFWVSSSAGSCCPGSVTAEGS